MSDCWSTLGIESTKERRAIKIAYTNGVKKNNPESHPEQFQALRSAYEEALYLSSFIDEEEEDEAGFVESTQTIILAPNTREQEAAPDLVIQETETCAGRSRARACTGPGDAGTCASIYTRV